MNNQILENMSIKNNYLSKYACLDSDALYLKEDKKDFRGTFYRDIDKILYSLSYIRYMDKTQVFTVQKNNHITKRMLHVQLVSKIARTIGRALALNEDLIEAIALGHDLGHVPFGHVGEKILDRISMDNNEGHFNHNIHSVRMLTNVENYGKGLNVSLQTLDGIMCHNGEFARNNLQHKNKTKEDFFEEYNASYVDENIINNLIPMTLEASVVRISDMIAYLGRDIEDGIRLNIVKRTDLPKDIIDVLGTDTKSIVNIITTDIINNSLNKNCIVLSDDIFKAIVALKKFNYINIYSKANTEKDLNKYNDIFNRLFNKYLNDLKTDNQNSLIFSSYINNMDESYVKNNSYERIVIDYLAGMTDEYIIKQYNDLNVIE